MLAKILDVELTNQIREIFETKLVHHVSLLFFFSNESCVTCDATRQLLEEITSVSDKIHLSQYNFETELPLAQKYNVQLTPSLVVAGGEGKDLMDYGIRLTGIPSGYEFTSLIQAILLVSTRDSGLQPAVRDQLKDLKKPVQLQIFVTPTCHYCPQAVTLAHRMALESPMIQAEMIEANEFYDLATRYNVSSVPYTNINDGAGMVLGAVPPEYLLQEIKETV